MDDFELIHACVSGKKTGWDEFVHRHSTIVYDAIQRTFRHYGSIPQPETVADLHQDIFLSFLSDDARILRQYEGRNGCSLAHYVRTVALRKTIDHLRKQRKTVSIDEVTSDEAGPSNGLVRALTDPSNAFDLAVAQDNVDIARKIMAHLKAEDRDLCTRVFLDKQDPAAIAKDLGISVDYFYTCKKRLLEKLRAIAIKQNFLTP